MGDLRHGFTTGSCAAAAAKAATYMLLFGGNKNRITIETPKGIPYDADIVNIEKSEDSVRCGVVKDGGDDPDVTTGLIIYARVSRIDYERLNKDSNVENDNIDSENGDNNNSADKGIVEILGGPGVGVVTKPGLDQKVGNAAINSVPREMIEKEVREVLDLADERVGIRVEISAPGGEEVAKKTFNPRLGIEGGISIIGTSGIVEPMSMDAIIETIKVELRQKYEEQVQSGRREKIVSVSPGNYGVDFMMDNYGFDLDQSVKCSNFIGITCDAAKELGFNKLLLAGHSGKLVKIAGGIMNTHSRESDGRMEILSSHAALAVADINTVKKILDSNTTDEAFGILKEKGLMEQVGASIVDKIIYYLDKRVSGDMEIECIMFSRELGLLGKSVGADALIEEIKNMEN